MAPMGNPIDPAPFDSAMPAAARAVIERARAGEGPARAWLINSEGGWGQVSDCFGLLRGHPEPLPPEVVGWLVGIGMFGDDLNAIPDVIVRNSRREVIPFVLDAFAAGVHAGVPTMKRQWKAIEDLVKISPSIPPSLASVLPLGCCLDQALGRGVALRLAQRLGEPARRALEAARTTASKPHARRIDEALAALSGGAGAGPKPSDTTASLARLLDAWRDTHDPALEDPIARIGTDLARARGAIAARSKGELEGAWLALAALRDPADLDRLLDTPWPGAWKSAQARVDALSRFAPDPRTGLKLSRLAASYSSMGSFPLHCALARVLASAPTAAMSPGLDAVEAARWGSDRVYATVRQAIAALQPRAADPALLDELGRGSRPAVDIAALFAQHVASPGDLGLRGVLADALQDAGDPRGEFIALQIAIADGTADAKARKRASALLAAHIDEWTGPLPDVERASRRFERGFLVALRCAARPALAASFERPEWATVEELDIDGRGCDLRGLLRRMPLLRTLSCSSDDVLEHIESSGPHPTLRTIGCGHRWIPKDRAMFPRLAVLGGQWIGYRWDSERFREIERAAADLHLEAIVHLGFPLDGLGAALVERGHGPPETRFTIGYMPRGSFDAPGWRVRVFRDRPRAEIAWGGGRSYERDSMGTIVERLAAAGISEMAFAIDKKLRARIEPYVARLPAVTISLDGSPIDLAGTTDDRQSGLR